MKLLLIRHGETYGNAAGGDYSVQNAGDLSPRGKEQARVLASRLESWEIDKVIASPSERALYTIAPYLSATGRTAEVWPELTEACWHDERERLAEAWPSQPATLPEDIEKHFHFRDGNAIRPGNPNTFGMGLRRVHDALTLIEGTFAGTEQTILVTSHRFFIRELLNLMLKLPSHEPFNQNNCGMTLVSWDTEWTLEFFNQTLHTDDTFSP